MKVAVLDHGMGNLRSVAKALEAAGAAVEVTGADDVIEGSDALCVPGQGIYGRCMDNLRVNGHDELIRRWIDGGRPYLGICLGMQVLFSESEERGPVAGLDLLAGEVTRLRGDVPVPHIGWNTVDGRGGEPEYFYFDHSYAVHPADDGSVTGWCEHGQRFAARIDAGPVTAVQFHPEKSSRSGIRLLREWIMGA